MHPALGPGSPAPLGATYDGQGVNFAVFSEWGHRLELCLFAPEAPQREISRQLLPSVTRHVHHGYLPGLKPGALYGFRAHGPYAPEKGLRFNPHKLLMDPYARAILGGVNVRGPIHGYAPNGKEDLVLDPRDSASSVPRCMVVNPAFDWEGVRPPRIPWSRTVIYEAHVKGFTRLHPGVPPELRGTYGGLAHPAAIAHFHRLGVTAVELLPVHQTAAEGFLVEKGLTNYWGYNTLGYFAPEVRYTCSGPRNVVNEFKGMVKALHRAGIEVILDVVYNHTCEGNHLGPTLSLRGLDNLAYYRTSPDSARYYADVTGTGNTLNVSHPQVVKLIADSLRYWVEEMHVDGFRFDLAATLGRDRGDFSPRAALFQVLHQDPVLSRVKLIAEPWDVGHGGYQVGNFPVDFSEWNGKYRDAVRRFWKGDDNLAAELGYRLTGSSDLYLLSGRGPEASINFLTAHDGFTLHDLVRYAKKHNEANGESNRDGSEDNHSWNHGVEGETTDPAINRIREQQQRNLLATLFLSQGVPMLLGGDELSRTQKGNNNAYCQDNAVSWLDWSLDERRQKLLDFVTRLIWLRQGEPVLHRKRFFRGKHIWDSELKDLAWYRADGKEMTQDDWQRPGLHSLGFLLGGDAFPPGEGGERVAVSSLFIILNASPEAVAFSLPPADWEHLLDTAEATGRPQASALKGTVQVPGRCVWVLRRPPGRAAP
jgi:glycogen operon protein